MNIAYIRKSTDRDDMQALSLEAQEKIVKELANKDGTTISKIYVDKITATKPKVRPAFNDMIKDINKGKIQRHDPPADGAASQLHRHDLRQSVPQPRRADDWRL